MKRIVSKVDYEMYQKGITDPKLALNLWYRICKNQTIIENAVTVIKDENGEKRFLAPSICHMILSNPWDVDKKLYDDLVLTILKDSDLNKISVFRNMSFLCLIIFNGALGFDDWYLKLTSDEISKKTQDKPFEARRISYTDMPNDGEVAMQYKTADFNISLTDIEISCFEEGKHINLNTVFGYEEIDQLVEMSKLFPNLDERILRSIDELHQMATNYQLYESQTSGSRS